jgi:Protein containing von Willebrand factor type A (vWA) domain
MNTPSSNKDEEQRLQTFLEQPESAHGERLLYRLTEFGRLLWESGIAVGPHQIIDLAETLNSIDIRNKEDFYAALKCSLVTRHEQEPIFDQMFDYFWFMRTHLGQKPKESKQGSKRKERQLRLPPNERKRLAEHLNASEAYKDLHSEMRAAERKRAPEDVDERTDNDLGDPIGSVYSALEQFRTKDFENYTWEEVQEAKRMMAAMRWHLGTRMTRRKSPARNGNYPDLRRMLRRNIKYGGEMIEFAWRKPKRKPRPLVIICDISGSMSLYSRLLLHFVHTISNGLLNVESFVFGTRLTRITRQLMKRDVDDAVRDVSKAVQDWSGGTRIGDALHTFNYRWARRVLGHGAVVLIISDGWDRGETDVLRTAMDRLQHSCHRLLWLNPLLGSPDYRPLTMGMKTALPFVDDFLPANNLNSLIDLGNLLANIDDNRPDRNSITHQKKVAQWSKPRYRY